MRFFRGKDEQPSPENNAPIRLSPEEYAERAFQKRLAGFREQIQSFDPPIGFDYFEFSPEVATLHGQATANSRLIDTLPEYETIAERLYTTLLEVGGIFSEGKFYLQGEVQGDFRPIYWGGGFKNLTEEAIDALNLRLVVSKAVRIFGETDSSGKPQGDQRKSVIVSHEIPTSELARIAKAPQLENIFGDEKVTVIVHVYSSGSSSRGHLLRNRMFYVFPGMIGEHIEQDILQDPWSMEALSEYVVQEAERELKTQPTVFQFTGLTAQNQRDYSILEHSVTTEIVSFTSLYNK